MALIISSPDVAAASSLPSTIRSAPQALSGPGAVNVTSRTTLFTSTGADDALTLADGSFAGQRKSVIHSVVGGSGVLTPASPGNFASARLVGLYDTLELEWTGSVWNLLNPPLVVRDLIRDLAPGTATTTSATFATLASSASLPFSGRPVEMSLHVSMFDSAGAAELWAAELAVNFDGGADTVIGKATSNINNNHTYFSMAVVVTPPAGAHVVNLRWRRTGGTGTITMDLNDMIILMARE